MNPHETIAAMLDENQSASVAAVISLLADKTTFEQRLAALKAAAEHADKKMKDAQALAEKHANAESMLSQATAMLMKQNDTARELDARENAVVEREQRLSAAEKSGREEHTRIEVALAAREKRVEHREQLLTEGQANLAQAKTQVDAQVASLAEFRGLAQSLRNPA